MAFLSNGLGASTGPIGTAANGNALWRISYFGHVADLTVGSDEATFDGQKATLPVAPVLIGGDLFIPWQPFATFLGFRWSFARTQSGQRVVPDHTLMLVQYSATFIQEVRQSAGPDRTRIVVELSTPSRVVASREGNEVHFALSAARRPSVPSVIPIHDKLVPRAGVVSGNWSAQISVPTNYAVPVKWFTLGSPPRLVVDFQKLFEEQSSSDLSSGLSLTRIRKGTGHGPVQMFVVRIDPEEGWRLRVAPAGYNVFQRQRPSRVAAAYGALVAANGGFFATDGAAVGAVMVNGEWLRLPWKGRTAIGMHADGTGRIDNLQVQASAHFGSGLKLKIHDLNGWPSKNAITALTRHFRTTYKLAPGEVGVVVQNGKVISKPGAGYFNIVNNGFALVANGGAAPWLNRVVRGESATLDIVPIGWDDITSALGGGPRLVRDSKVDVTALQENFRADVRIGLGPRTAVGIDAKGRYILAVVDGRQGYYSSGFTLTEMAYVMQGLGAVDAMNFDGGGSTSITVRGKVINRPSDGVERPVSNSLLVMR